MSYPYDDSAVSFREAAPGDATLTWGADAGTRDRQAGFMPADAPPDQPDQPGQMDRSAGDAPATTAATGATAATPEPAPTAQPVEPWRLGDSKLGGFIGTCIQSNVSNWFDSHYDRILEAAVREELTRIFNEPA